MSFEEDRDIFPFPGRGKSSVWEYFGFYKTKFDVLDKSKAICKRCRKGVTYSGNTTNLRAHIMHNHRGEEGLDEKALFSVSSHAVLDSQSHDPDRNKLQTFSNGINHLNCQTSNKVTYACFNLIVGELVPVEILESKAFHYLVSSCGGRVSDIPNAEEVNSVLVSNYYSARQKVMDCLSKAESEYLKVEIWSTLSSISYMTISVQVLSDNWKADNYVLATFDLGDFYTDKQLTEFISKTLQEWNLSEEITVLTCGSDKVKHAVKKLQCEHVVSMTATIDKAAKLCVEDSTVRSVTKHVRNIAEMFKNNTNARTILQDKQKVLKMRLQNLELCEVGSWKSVLEMLESFNDMTPAILASFSDPNLITESKIKMLTAKETSLVHCIIGLLQPLKKGYSLSHNMKCPTMSVILPVLKKLELELQSSDCDSQALSGIKTSMLNQLSLEYSDKSHRDLLLLCSLLDPRFKDLKFVRQAEQEIAYDLLKQSAADITNIFQGSTDTIFTDSPPECNIKIEVSDDQEFAPCSNEDVAAVSELMDHFNQVNKSNKKRRLSTYKSSALQPDPMNDWLADVVQDNVPENKQNDPISNEISRYKSELQILSTSSPLYWWKDRSNTYPILSQVAKKYACAPAILSNSSEKRRSLYERQRACLPESSLDMMVFLNANIDVSFSQ